MTNNLEDITLMIPVRIDSIERKENLSVVINYYRSHGIKVLIGEEDTVPRCADLDSECVRSFFYSSGESFFYRTRVLNKLLASVETQYVANYDCDVLFPISQISETIELIRSGADMVYPYAGHFVDVSRVDVPKISAGNFHINGKLIHPNSIGGAVFFRTKVYKEGGGENENFISWSPEDLERYERFSKLGYKTARAKGKCYHMTHPRGINSDYINPYWDAGNEELHRVRQMEPGELRRYIRFNPDKFFNTGTSFSM